MRLWTVQSIEVWHLLNEKGHYEVEAAHVRGLYADAPDILRAYEWMVEQMRMRLGGSNSNYPIWAWLRPKPDLRRPGHLPKGRPGVRLEVEVPDEEVVLSDFELWHYLLNYWYIPESEEDCGAWEKDLEDPGIEALVASRPYCEPLHSRIVSSWNKIFDLDWYDSAGSIAWPRDQKAIQATFWTLRLDQVKRVTQFIAR